ncbi:MAG: SPFH domain-containing protein [Patescibacteria group bacterium]|jgi:regulator of protease activity HflC (stomatin/prohibitin superfamily)
MSEWSASDYVLLAAGIVAGIFALITFLGSFFTVPQQRVAMVTRFGKFVRVAHAGLNFKIPWIESVAGWMTLQYCELKVEVETKTQDNVFVKVIVAVQYYVLEDRVYQAYYKLRDATKQITSFVYDVVRARVPKMKLDDVFEKKDEIADAVKTELAEIMDDFGYGILKAPVTDIDPDAKVKTAMNEINAAQRERVAAAEKGEAEKILQVKKAEAEAESKKLQGEGIANQRKAIVNGLRESVEAFTQSVDGTTAKDVMQLVLMTQYFDTLKDIGASAKTSAVFVPHSPGALADLSSQMRDAVIAGNQVGGAPNAPAADPKKKCGGDCGNSSGC